MIKNFKWWSSIGLTFAICGYFLAEIVSFNLVTTIGNLMGDNLTLPQIKALDSLYTYRYFIVVLTALVFWIFGNSVEILIKLKSFDKETNK